MTSSSSTTPSAVVTQTQELKLRARQLTVEQGNYEIDWQESGADVPVALRAGSRKGTYLPTHGEGGHIVIALDVDHMPRADVATDTPVNADTAEMLDYAAEHLRVLARGIRQAQSGSAGREARAAITMEQILEMNLNQFLDHCRADGRRPSEVMAEAEALERGNG